MPFINLISKNSFRQKELALKLVRICSKSLSCKENQLKESDFSVVQFEPELAYLSADTEVRIFAHNYPSRENRIDEIAKEIQDSIEIQYPNSNLKVFVFLLPIGFVSTK